MITQPRLEYRPEQHFVAIRQHVSVPFGPLLGPLWGEVGGWLGARGLTPAGPPIIRYLTCDMSKDLYIEVGFPVAAAVTGDERVFAEVFPAGRYATLVYSGPYDNDGLVKATAALLDWAQENHITWQTSMLNDVEWWRARSEFYHTDPAVEPDPEKWQTELVFLTAEA
jgi:effector-binding domain-containing protein